MRPPRERSKSLNADEGVPPRLYNDINPQSPVIPFQPGEQPLCISSSSTDPLLVPSTCYIAGGHNTAVAMAFSPLALRREMTELGQVHRTTSHRHTDGR